MLVLERNIAAVGLRKAWKQHGDGACHIERYLFRNVGPIYQTARRCIREDNNLHIGHLDKTQISHTDFCVHISLMQVRTGYSLKQVEII
jgi:hypothetical protein